MNCNDIEPKYSKQGCLMKIVKYNSYDNIIVEFQDKYKALVHTRMEHFKNGSVKNPYHPSVYGFGYLGHKYPTKINGKDLLEYKIWHSMIQRCYDNKLKNIRKTYEDVTCCDEWLCYETFYEWLHNQSNFETLVKLNTIAVDKDILHKGNKIYSPNNCCLVPINVNSLFVKKDASRGQYPIGVSYYGANNIKKYKANCSNPFTKKYVNLGYYDTPEKAFEEYKTYKEKIIKKVALSEYEKGTITDACYKAMMSYQVEITD